MTQFDESQLSSCEILRDTRLGCPRCEEKQKEIERLQKKIDDLSGLIVILERK
jgi:hypothetical protein